MVLLVALPKYRIRVALLGLEPRPLVPDAYDGIVDPDRQPIVGRRHETEVERTIPLLPGGEAVGAVAALDAINDELEVAVAGVQRDGFGKPGFQCEPEFHQFGGARVAQRERLGPGGPLRHGPHDRAVSDLPDDPAGLLQLGERHAHHVARGAELRRQLALGGDAFARLDATLVDLPLDQGLYLIDMLPLPRARIPRPGILIGTLSRQSTSQHIQAQF